jgi:hypothetical protein
MKPSPNERPALPLRHFLPLKIAGVLLAFTLSSFAKDSTLSAIVLFTTPVGPGYVQLTGVALNGKTELRTCEGVPTFDKHSYDLLPRVQLSAASVLERAADGVLMLSTDGTKPFCVLPNGLKFESNSQLTPAQAADQIVLSGIVAQASMQPAEVPPVKPGVKFVFVAAPDTEFAEYLLAQRVQSIHSWQDYLKRYPASAHTAQVRQALAAILTQDAESALAEYSRSVVSNSPQLALLKLAQNYSAQIEALSSSRDVTDKLRQAIHMQLDLLLEKTGDSCTHTPRH